MADGLNRVLLMGNLGQDPELRQTGNGQAVLRIRMATTESYLDRNRTRQERTEWHSVTVWGKRAEALAKILSKGSRIFVEGGLRTSSYDDRDGNKRYRTEITAQNIILAGGGRRSSSSSSSHSSSGGSDDYDDGSNYQYGRGDDEPEDDIPF